MNIETIIAIIAAVGGLSGLVSAISTAVFKYLEYQKAQKGETLEAKLDEKLKPLMDINDVLRQTNDELKAELKEIRLDTTRIQLLDLMHDEPTNHDTILTVAHRYFCQLSGDWIASVEFQAWADKEKINIPDAISQAIVENDKK